MELCFGSSMLGVRILNSSETFMETKEESRSDFSWSLLKCCCLFEINGVVSQPSRSPHIHPHHSWNNFAHSSSLPEGDGHSLKRNSLVLLQG